MVSASTCPLFHGNDDLLEAAGGVLGDDRVEALFGAFGLGVV